MKKNVASQVIGAEMINATTGAAFTSTVTVYVTGDAGTQAIGSVGSGICTHEGNGFHTYAPAQAETNYDHVAFTFIGTGAIPVTVQLYTDFPQTGDAFARIGAPAGASASADIAAVKVDTAAVKVKTDFLPSAAAGAAGGVFIAGTNAATTITTALTTTFTGNLTGAVGSVTGAVGSVTGAVGSVAGQTLANLDVASSTLATAANLATVAGYTDSIESRLPAALVGGRMDSSVGAAAADTLTASALAADAANEIADAIINRNISGGSSTGRTVKQALHFLRNKWSISAGTLTVTDTDDTTTSWTATVSTTAGNPVSTVDPA